MISAVELGVAATRRAARQVGRATCVRAAVNWNIARDRAPLPRRSRRAGRTVATRPTSSSTPTRWATATCACTSRASSRRPAHARLHGHRRPPRARLRLEHLREHARLRDGAARVDGRSDDPEERGTLRRGRDDRARRLRSCSRRRASPPRSARSIPPSKSARRSASRCRRSFRIARRRRSTSSACRTR